MSQVLLRMHALTLWQPWAHLIVRGQKRIENRTWAPPPSLHEMFFAIHAGKQWDGVAAKSVSDAGLHAPFALRREQVTFGAIVGVARLVGVVKKSASPWFIGPLGWVLDDVQAIDPVQCKGAQGLWQLTEEQTQTVLARVRKE